jgi:gliding motility-associated-like protein
MKVLKYILITFVFLLSFSNKAKAQIDTVFWFAASWVTPDHADNKPMAFHFSTFNNPTTIRLHQPASTYDTTFVVPANSLFTKYVTHILSQVESKPADDPTLTTGFKITSDFPIVVVYDFLSSGNNPETYSLKGQNGMGVEFITPFQTLWNNKTLGSDNNGDGVVTQPKQQFSVVASEPNTTIYITPRCNVVGHPANITYSVLLPFAGSVYTCENIVQNTSVSGNSLAGSIVVSDKKVSITTSDDSVNPSGGGGCYDLLGDQIVPVDVLGIEYNVNKGFLNAGSDESAFIVATQNFTTLTINDGTGVTTAIINQGDTYQYSITQQLTNIKADKNVTVLHMSGYGCELGSAILPPVNCAGSNQVSFPRTNSLSFLLDIICPTGAEGNFIVNGDPTIVQASDFSVIPGTGGAFLGAQVSVPTSVIAVGSSNIISNSSDLFSLGIINGNAGGGCLYHYLSTFLRRVTVNAGVDTTVCTATTQIDLNGTVEGGVTTGIWSVLNGTGTLNTPTNLVTTYDIVQSDYAQSFLTFVLQSTGNCDPVTDTLKISFAQSPEVTANTVSTYCKNNIAAIPISGTMQYAVGTQWSGGNGGAFGNPGDINTTYIPSPSDLANDSVVLYLTSVGSLFSCPDNLDSTVIHFTNPPNVVAGADQVICTNQFTVNLNGVVSGASTTGIWSTAGSGSFSPTQTDLNADYLVSAADQSTGNFYLYLSSTNNGNCLAVTDSLELLILPEPTATITTQDSLCANIWTLPLTGTVTGGFSTVWTVNGGGTVVAPNSLNTSYSIVPTDTIGGFLDIILETTGGICPTQQDSIRLHFVAPPIVDAGVDQSFCANELVQLTGGLSGTANSATWTSTGTGSFTPNNTSLNSFYQGSALDITNGSVQLILTSSADFGCNADDDTITITYLQIPSANFSYNSACEGSQTNFTDLSTSPSGQTLNTWTYYFGDGGNSIAQNPIHTYTGAGNYNVIQIVEASNGCADTITKSVNVNPTPSVIFSNSNACQGNEVFFIDNSFISSGAFNSWSWDFDNGNGTSTIQNPSYTFDNAGNADVTLTVVSDSNCVASLTKIIDVLEGPNADFSFSPTSAFTLEDVFFTDQSTNGPIDLWLWEFGDGNGETSQNPVHQFADGGTYYVTLTVTDTSGCVNSTNKEILVGLPPALPSAFTPNGDGENDVFIIRGGPFDEVNFKVYNNWGQLIFTSTDVNVGWDGTYNGEDAPLGVYTWTFTVVVNETIITKEGDVTLMR